jgi:phosphoribosylformylglycinamidine cyclo-ligase
MGISYKDAGVDIDAGNTFVSIIKQAIKNTFNVEKEYSQVLTDIGGFSGLIELNWNNFKEPILAASCDGVGTKVKLAQLIDKHDTIGIDLVAMCVNDIVVCGAKPVFFLDYLATGKLNIDMMKSIITGIITGCKQAGCILLGGETAEMPGMYSKDEYDLAGFAVGIVDKSKIITGINIADGDVIVGIASSGIHSNGYSLIRKILKEEELIYYSDILLIPTKIYNIIPQIVQEFEIKGIVHITGGGFIDNIPRILPDKMKAYIKKGSWDIPEIFYILQDKGDIDDIEMYRIFNMGIGMVLIISSEIVDSVIRKLQMLNEKVFIIGEITKGEEKGIKIV